MVPYLISDFYPLKISIFHICSFKNIWTKNEIKNEKMSHCTEKRSIPVWPLWTSSFIFICHQFSVTPTEKHDCHTHTSSSSSPSSSSSSDHRHHDNERRSCWAMIILFSLEPPEGASALSWLRFKIKACGFLSSRDWTQRGVKRGRGLTLPPKTALRLHHWLSRQLFLFKPQNASG